ncbi:MAG: DUF2865 domain-containing protein [Alphaproteobacteria bacterium]|nr:DUF2865 domain-containing protein [Alphaproteobacteria bacterium]
MSTALYGKTPSYCGVLERELISNSEDLAQRLESLNYTQNIRLQDYNALNQRLKRLGCNKKKNLMFFDSAKPQNCRALENQFRQVSFTLEKLKSQRARLIEQRSQGPNKQYILQLLGDNQCGSEYEKYAHRTSRYSLPDWLAGDSNVSSPFPEDSEKSPDSPQIFLTDDTIKSYKTVCVRRCDGYYFPISFATIPEYFNQDDQNCQKMCPGAKSELYIYKNPGESIEDAISSASGETYLSHPKAFVHHERYVQKCSCEAEIISPNEINLPEKKDLTIRDRSSDPITEAMTVKKQEDKPRVTITTGTGQFTISDNPSPVSSLHPPSSSQSRQTEENFFPPNKR